jgi:hypothetical protein
MLHIFGKQSGRPARHQRSREDQAKRHTGAFGSQRTSPHQRRDDAARMALSNSHRARSRKFSSKEHGFEIAARFGGQGTEPAFI